MPLWLRPYLISPVADFLILQVMYFHFFFFQHSLPQPISVFGSTLVTILHFALFFLFNIYRQNLKQLNLYPITRIFFINATMGGLMIGISFLFLRSHHLSSISIFILAAELTGLIVAHRLFWFFYLNPESRVKKTGLQPIVIYGAGTVAYHLLQDLSAEDLLGRYRIVAVVDNNPEKIASHLGPYRVQSGDRLRELVAKYQVQEIWFTMPVSPSFLSAVVDSLNEFSLAYKVIPRKLEQFTPDIRNLKIEDLIQRPEIRLKHENLRDVITGKRILITGAAGSIGRELAKQIAQLNPSRLTLIDQWEHGVFQVERDFEKSPTVYCAVADIRNEKRIYALIAEEKPQIVFHAAAYKHVPLMEIHYAQALDTNILGTWHLLSAIKKYAESAKQKVKLINISTDKAVSPENVMGITKRISELLVYNFARLWPDEIETTSVRFGNVLGSSGSAVPIFWDQIKNGGPVTVTHPDMERFFMTIPEAVRLVLHAVTISEPQDILALDMGKPVRIAELAERLILLAGKKPNVDVKIEFTGIRPGEKLREELFWEKDSVQTTIPFIFRSTGDLKELDVNEFIRLLRDSMNGQHSRQWYVDFLRRYI